MRTTTFLVCTFFLFLALNEGSSSGDTTENHALPEPVNVLFIAVDDLRPELGCYGSTLAKTPCIDSLASNAFVFEHAICSVPVCGASRASVMTGLRPNHSRFIKFSSRADEDAPGIPIIAEWFKSKGYKTLSNGKILHKNKDSADAWSEKPWRPKRDFRDYQEAKNQMIASTKGHGPATEKGSNDAVYADDEILERSLNDLENLARTDDPFFLAVGFFKPHLPFCAPTRFWDLYSAEDIGLANNRFTPENAPEAALHSFGELRAYTDIPNDDCTAVPDSTQNRLRHGYFACVSYVDHLVGQLISKLSELDIAEETMIVLWGDHGWQLGEHNLWAKHCNFQTSLQVPLIIKYPNQTENVRVKQVVELIDLYPTLCEAAGIASPKHIQGVDLKRVTNSSIRTKRFEAFSKFHGGETITTSEYSYTEFRGKQNSHLRGTMLYDLRSDPEENHSVAGKSGYAEIEEKLKSRLDSLRINAGIPILER